MSTPKYELLPSNAINHDRDDEGELENPIRIETAAPPKRQSRTKVHLVLCSLGLIALYLTLSIILTFYQGWLLKDHKFPLSIVLYHLVIKLLMSATLRYFYTLVTGKSRVLLDFRTSFKKISPTGLASGIDIGFSNWGLELVNISLYTMTKSSTIIFILFFAILLGLEKKSWSLIVIVVMIAGGLAMFTYKATKFDVLGFAFLLFASFTSGIRWSFAQLIMQKSKLGLHNPVDMIFHMQPWMILSIFPFTVGFEGKRLLEVYDSVSMVQYNDIFILFLQITMGAVIAFVMEVSEFMVLSHTSSLTLSITGIFKDICQLVLAVKINGDQLSPLNVLGLIMCICGICSHVAHKYSTYSRTQSDENKKSASNRDMMTNNIQSNMKFRYGAYLSLCISKRNLKE